MYAKLLAKSMHMDEKQKVHPSYVHIISQLSPIDARHLAVIKREKYVPCVNYAVTPNAQGKASKVCVVSNVIIEDGCTDDILFSSASMSNLARFGLIEFDFKITVTNANYTKFRSKQMSHQLESAPNFHKPPSYDYIIENGVAQITSFGNFFADVCI